MEEIDIFQHSSLDEGNETLYDSMDEVYEDDDALYSEDQKLALSIMAYCSSFLSLAGSFVIIYVILADQKKEVYKSICYRIVLGLSSMDFLASFGIFAMGPWAVPEGSNAAWGEKGTIATCTMSGFLFNFHRAIQTLRVAKYCCVG